jgi:hypothetical protein
MLPITKGVCFRSNAKLDQTSSFMFQLQGNNCCTVDGESVGLALPHKLWSNDAWTDGCAKNAMKVVHQGSAILNALQ